MEEVQQDLAIIPGQELMSFEDFKYAMDQWAVAEGFTFFYQKSDTTRKILKCRMVAQVNCPFYVRAIWHEMQGCVRIMRVDREHTCLGAALPMRSIASRQRWLVKVVPQLLLVQKSTKPLEIQNAIRIKFNTQIDYQAAHKVKHTLLGNTLQQEQEGFCQLPGYIQLLQQKDPTIYTHLSIGPDTRFQRLFICPSASKYSFTSCQLFVAVDETFLKTRYIQTLLLAVTIDANNEILPLAYAVVESENTSSWEYFLLHLKSAIPRIDYSTIISDRDKGLLTAIPNCLPHAVQAYCCQHLAANVQKRYLLAARTQFWKIARGKTPQAFDDAYIEMEQLSQPAAQYL